MFTNQLQLSRIVQRVYAMSALRRFNCDIVGTADEEALLEIISREFEAICALLGAEPSGPASVTLPADVHILLEQLLAQRTFAALGWPADTAGAERTLRCRLRTIPPPGKGYNRP